MRLRGNAGMLSVMSGKSSAESFGSKAELRTRYKSCLTALEDERGRSVKLLARLESFEVLKRADSLVGFVPIRHEPDVMAFMKGWLENGKRLYLPVFLGAEAGYGLAEVGGLDEKWLTAGKYGIPEPRPTLERILSPFHFAMSVVWLVPGIAFAPDGTRLGRGGGYYDRLLEDAGGIKAGVLFECQLAEKLPSFEHDIRMDYLLTEEKTVNCAMSR